MVRRSARLDGAVGRLPSTMNHREVVATAKLEDGSQIAANKFYSAAQARFSIATHGKLTAVVLQSSADRSF